MSEFTHRTGIEPMSTASKAAMLPNLLEITISWIFCPSNAHNSYFQSFPEKKYFLPVVWVYALYVNRIHANSLVGCYATTTPTMLRRLTIVMMNFKFFKRGFFLTHFRSVTSRKNQNNYLRSGVNFSLTRTICSQSSKAVVVSGLLLLQVNGNSKNDKNLLFQEYFFPLTHTIVISIFPWN